MSEISVGLALPVLGPNATVGVIEALSDRGEEGGFDHLWLADHVAMPVESQSRYPFGGDLGIQAGHPILEPLATIGYVAGRTERIKVGLSVLILAMRNPVLAASMLRTLDVLARGRLILGVGVGWLREEFEALSMPFEGRGARMEEWLDIFRGIYGAESPVAHSGRDYVHQALSAGPPGPQPKGPPIWIGGNSPRAIDRAVRVGHVWHPALIPATELSRLGEDLERALDEHDRSPDTLGVGIRLDCRLGGEGEGSRGGVGGSPEQVVEGLMEYREAGADTVILTPREATAEALVEHVDRLGAEVLPLLRGGT